MEPVFGDGVPPLSSLHFAPFVGAMLVLSPLSIVLLVAAIVFGARGDAVAPVFVVGLFVLVVGWNAYYLLLWRPQFERRFPTDQP